jgi:hypothetical protein
MTRAARPRRRRQHVTAVRQALGLCEAELLRLSWDRTGMPPSTGEQPASGRSPQGRRCGRPGCRRTSPPGSAAGCA